MPNCETHCKISKERTGKDFKELHKWMDEATEYLGSNHRLERHFFTQEYKDYIEKKWGKKAVVEWLFHISIDNLETANKFAVDAYKGTNYDQIDFIFDKKDISSCEFIRFFDNSRKSSCVYLKEGAKELRISNEKKDKYQG